MARFVRAYGFRYLDYWLACLAGMAGFMGTLLLFWRYYEWKSTDNG